jgi:predicted aldo/keto reductase-like oxidoreductase
MSQFSRRDFITGVSAAAGTTLLTDRLLAADSKSEAPSEAKTTAKPETKVDAKPDPNAKIKHATDVVKLGKTGLKPTLLGLGTGTIGGSVQRSLGDAEFTKFVRHALDRGIRYVDTADMYQTHPFVRRALEGVSRDKYFIQSKMMTQGMANTSQAKTTIERLLKELNTDYVDALLMHAISNTSWPMAFRPMMDAMKEAKEKGQIKACGLSIHGLGVLQAAAESDWLDTILVRVNPFNLNMDAAPDQVVPLVKKIHDKGCGVIGMKIYGETGLKSPEERLQSLRYVMGLGCVDCFTIGFNGIKQFDETMDLIERAAIPA